MRLSKKWDQVSMVLRWIVAIIFIFAGITKILNPLIFATDIDNYRLIPYFLVTILAVVLPWLEVLSGLFLIAGKFQKGATLILLLLSFTFIVAISSAIIRGLDITCGCFVLTNEGIKVGYEKLGENVILFAMIVWIYVKLER